MERMAHQQVLTTCNGVAVPMIHGNTNQTCCLGVGDNLLECAFLEYDSRLHTETHVYHGTGRIEQNSGYHRRVVRESLVGQQRVDEYLPIRPRRVIADGLLTSRILSASVLPTAYTRHRQVVDVRLPTSRQLIASVMPTGCISTPSSHRRRVVDESVIDCQRVVNGLHLDSDRPSSPGHRRVVKLLPVCCQRVAG